MKKVISNLSFHNWNKEAGKIITGLAGSFGMLAVWSDEFLRLLHDAPFPVSSDVDLWVKWLLKIIASVLSVLTLLSKRKNDIDIGVKISDVAASDIAPDLTALGKNQN